MPPCIGAKGVSASARSSRVRLLTLVAFALLVAACGGGEEEPPEVAGARVRVAAIGWDAADLDALSLWLDDGRAARAVTGASLNADENYGQPHSPWFPTATGGDLAVTARLELPRGDTVTKQIHLTLRPDWEWEVQVVRAADDPIATCFGCAGSERLTPTAGSDAAVWLVWGGNSITDPVVY